MSNYHLLVVKPDIFVSTAEAFSAIVPQKPSLSFEEEIKMPVEKWTLKNDFEDSIFPQYPELLEIKKSLIQAGALYASMSGSGSSIYAIFSEKPQLNLIIANFFIKFYSLIALNFLLDWPILCQKGVISLYFYKFAALLRLVEEKGKTLS